MLQNAKRSSYSVWFFMMLLLVNVVVAVGVKPHIYIYTYRHGKMNAGNLLKVAYHALSHQTLSCPTAR